MAIDYVLGVGCEPHKHLGVERLVELNRTRILARSALAQMRNDGDDRDPKQIEIQLTVRQPSGDSARGVTLQDLLDESNPLDVVTPYCEQCPAQLGRELACHRRIRYPIPEKVEIWLMSRLPNTLASTAGVMLVRALSELGWTGEPAAKLRASGDTYFESRIPHGVRWEAADGSAIEMSSDQLFQMMFMVGPLAPTHCLMLALFTGVLPHDTSVHDLKDAAGRERVLSQVHLPPQEDPDIEQLAAFLRAVATAARRDIPLLIDG